MTLRAVLSAICTEVEQRGRRERALRVARDSGLDCGLEDFDIVIGVREGYRSRNQLARAPQPGGSSAWFRVNLPASYGWPHLARQASHKVVSG